MRIVRRPKNTYVPASAPHTRLLKYGFVVDILADPKMDPPIYHCIIQRPGAKEILYWSQERTYRDAELNAEGFLAAHRPERAHSR